MYLLKILSELLAVRDVLVSCRVEAEGRCLFAAQTAAAVAVECGVNSLSYATVSCLLSAVLIVVIIHSTETSCLLYYSTIYILYFLDLASDVVVVASKGIYYI